MTLEHGDELVGDPGAGGYRILGRIGEGNMAEVFLARSLRDSELRAIKRLKGADEIGFVRAIKDSARRQRAYRDLLQRHRREIRSLSQILAQRRHPNVVHLYDCISVAGIPCPVLEFVEGGSLARWMERHGKGSLDASLRLFADVLAGVEAIHTASIVHRDLKPANVLLVPGGGAKITDFGLAKDLAPDAGESVLTHVGQGLGTPKYVSVEQARNATSVDARTDVFALGCILYELCTGYETFPHGACTSFDTAARRQAYLPPESLNPALPAEVLRAITGALVEDRDHRIASCKELRETLGIGDTARGLRAGWEQPPPYERIKVSAGPLRFGRAGVPSSVVADFWIGRHPVTNAQYARFLEDNTFPRPRRWLLPPYDGPHQPVVGVSRAEANAYCDWVGGFLPSEEQWERAARGEETWAWPWGPSPGPDPTRAVFSRPADAGPLPVGGRPASASPFGAEDMLGNVWEWTKWGVLRGGGWSEPLKKLVLWATLDPRPGGAEPLAGFRVAFGAP